MFQVSAEAQKRIRNSKIEYKLQEGGAFEHQRFTINNETGTITTLRPLDREQNSFYELFVTAEDGGHGSNTAVRMLGLCLIRMNVQDANDEYPRFYVRQYKGKCRKVFIAFKHYKPLRSFSVSFYNQTKGQYFEGLW